MSSGGVAVQMAHSLQRTQTAPVPFSSRSGPVSGLSHTMNHGSRSSQLSGSTAFTSSSASSLSSMSTSATLVPNPGAVQASNNIINQKADASKSLYQICVNLRQRLAQVPGFNEQLMHSEAVDTAAGLDPVMSLWNCLRLGEPLLSIYNAISPAEPLHLDPETAPAKRPKTAAFKFVQACLQDLKLPPGESFTLSDLFGDDTTGFVKVTQVIKVVLNIAEERGLLTTEAQDEPVAVVSGAQMTYRDHVVKEFVDTEQKYVQDLEQLHNLKIAIEQKGVLPGDLVHDIFLNINAILDFQRRFLIKIETTKNRPNEKQQWGHPFIVDEEYFGIYEPFIANQRKAADIAMREFDRIKSTKHDVATDLQTLDGFLLKPMQRLVKYPMLLKDLRDKGGATEAMKQELTYGIEAANRVLGRANSAVDRELRNEALADLCARVDDWKNHRVDHFGDLLLHGHFPVVTGKSDVQKEYTIYLFERILLCCKEANPNKSKEKLMGAPKDKKDKKDKKGKDGKASKLQLKGRIFMTNVTEVISLAKPGNYTVQIFWKGDPGVENFLIRFSNEDSMKKWGQGVDGQRREHAANTSTLSPEGQEPSFAWMRDQTANIVNPYAQQEDDEDDEEEYPGQQNTLYQAQPPSGFDRNASNSSLRSRSTTGESTQSLAGVVRAPPSRFPMGTNNPPLSVQTQLYGSSMPSPGQRGVDSYFSPVAESPASSRTSATSSMFPFPRQGTPQGWGEEHNRYTAPAMGRAPSRDSTTQGNAYSMGARGAQRPSLPAMAQGNSQASLAQQRNRSYSTPDINLPPGNRRTGPPSGSVPAVPGIPAHIHAAYNAEIPRSANSSPSGGLPMRTSTQSPGAQRDRILQAQFSANPQYNRANTTQIPMTPADNRTMSPPNSAVSTESDIALPTQLKVKVNCDSGNYVTLVVAFNITYQSLIDRIDAKVGRFSNNAIARGTMRLRYRDEDEDFVTIESDDDIQIAFQEWREAQKLQYHTGQLGEIELFCISVGDNSNS